MIATACKCGVSRLWISVLRDTGSKDDVSKDQSKDDVKRMGKRPRLAYRDALADAHHQFGDEEAENITTAAIGDFKRRKTSLYRAYNKNTLWSALWKNCKTMNRCKTPSKVCRGSQQKVSQQRTGGVVESVRAGRATHHQPRRRLSSRTLQCV